MSLTNKQLLEEVTALVKPLNERIGILESQKISLPAAKDDFVFSPVIAHFGLSKEKQQEFFNKLQAIMREYKIANVVAGLQKKL